MVADFIDEDRCCRNCKYHIKRKIPNGGMLTRGERFCVVRKKQKPLNNLTSKWYFCSKWHPNFKSTAKAIEGP